MPLRNPNDTMDPLVEVVAADERTIELEVFDTTVGQGLLDVA
jgi:hypothetical protein